MSRRTTDRNALFWASVASLPEPFTVAQIIEGAPKLTMHYTSLRATSAIAQGLLVEVGARTSRFRSLVRSSTLKNVLVAQAREPGSTAQLPSVSWHEGARNAEALVPWLAA